MCQYLQKQIVTTDWFPSGVFIDNMTLTVNYTLNSDNAVPLSDYTRILSGKIFKRHPRTHIIISSVDILFLHQKEICSTLGVLPKNVQNNLLSDAIFYFDPNYEYRLELYSGSSLSSYQSIILDYISLNYLPRSVVMNGGCEDTEGTVEVIEVNDNLSININSSGYGVATLQCQKLDTLDPINPSLNTLTTLFQEIKNVSVTIIRPDTWLETDITMFSVTTQIKGDDSGSGGQKAIIHVVSTKKAAFTITGSYSISGLANHIEI